MFYKKEDHETVHWTSWKFPHSPPKVTHMAVGWKCAISLEQCLPALWKWRHFLSSAQSRLLSVILADSQRQLLLASQLDTALDSWGAVEEPEVGATRRQTLGAREAPPLWKMKRPTLYGRFCSYDEIRSQIARTRQNKHCVLAAGFWNWFSTWVGLFIERHS